ncbi:JmjC domain-containing protein, partial [Haematococcus lacustris]
PLSPSAALPAGLPPAALSCCPAGCQVLDCRTWKAEDMSEAAFFHGYANGVVDDEGRPRMLKVKDWPPEQEFRERMVRHNQDFHELLPLPLYTHTTAGPLNLATMMPSWTNPTDLGPKTYV